MLKILLLGTTAIGLAACAAPHSARFLDMSPDELAAYNASVPQDQQVSCVEQNPQGTASRYNRVCSSNEKRLARLTRPSTSVDGANTFSAGTIMQPSYGNTSFSSRGGNLPRIHFSPPPPGYDQPVIHFIDGRRF